MSNLKSPKMNFVIIAKSSINPKGYDPNRAFIIAGEPSIFSGRKYFCQHLDVAVFIEEITLLLGKEIQSDQTEYGHKYYLKTRPQITNQSHSIEVSFDEIF